MSNVSKIGLIRASYFVYIMANRSNSALYTGVTSDLRTRCEEHLNKRYPNSFSAQYNINKLVYFEQFEDINAAIAREKQIKGGSRQKKIDLIVKENPFWNDLYEMRISKWR